MIQASVFIQRSIREKGPTQVYGLHHGLGDLREASVSDKISKQTRNDTEHFLITSVKKGRIRGEIVAKQADRQRKDVMKSSQKGIHFYGNS